MATSVQVLSKRKPYLKPHVQLEPRGFLEGYFEGVPHGVPRLQELGPYIEIHINMPHNMNFDKSGVYINPIFQHFLSREND